MSSAIEGADLAAMGDALEALLIGPGSLYVALFGIICVLGPTFSGYKRYAQVLKWSCLASSRMWPALATVKVPWGRSAPGFGSLPAWRPGDTDFFTRPWHLAIAGAISPYLFFWRAQREGGRGGEEIRSRAPTRCSVVAVAPPFSRIRADAAVGMAFSSDPLSHALS